MFENFIKNGILVTVATLIVCVLGIVAAFRIPVQMIPDLDVRVISVRTVWPGATPQDVEKEILIEQEEYLQNLPGLQRIVSKAQSGRAEIELEFPFGTNTTEMLIRVNNALSQVPSYPENVDQPQIYASSFSSNAFMFYTISTLPGNPRNLDLDLVLDFVEDNIKSRLTSIKGISEVFIFGGTERQIQILIDPARLAQRGLSLSDIRDAMRMRNRDRSAGAIISGKRQYMIRTIGRFDSLAEIEQLIVAQRNGSPVRLSEVATVQLSHSKKRMHATYNAEPSFMVIFRRQPGSNVIDIKRATQPVVDAVNREVLNPAGLQMVFMADDVHYVQNSVKNVWMNLIIGAVLATVVMYLFLRSVRATAIGVVGIPVCIIVAFLGLMAFGRTINVISLAGIAFAIGMTLDNSIVVLESIRLAAKQTSDRAQAALIGVSQVWPAVLASTLTTVLVFMPIAFVNLEVGQLYSDIAIAISAAIMASMVVAITVLPTAASNFDLHNGDVVASDHADSGAAGEASYHWVLRPVNWLLSSRYRRNACIAITSLFSLAIILWMTPPAEYLPEGEEPKIFAVMNAPPGYNLDAMLEIGVELNEYFMQFVGADPRDYHSGKSPVPAISYFNIGVQADNIRFIGEPADPGDSDALIPAITAKYKQYPGMNVFASRGSIITSNDGGTRSINVDISGENLTTTYDVAQTIYRKAQEVLQGSRIQTNPRSLTMAQPLIEIRPNWERAAELQITASELGFNVAALSDGAYVDEFFLGENKLDIYMYSTAGQKAQLNQLDQLPIYTRSGAILPLGALARIDEQVNTTTIRRVAGRRTVTLNIIPPRAVALETGVDIVRDDVVAALRAEGKIPNSVSTRISGAADQLQATREVLTSNYLIALIIIYLLLVAIFRHWGYPMLIMTSIPLGIAGGIVGLWLLNAVGGLLPVFGMPAISQPFDMITMLGFLILMGTVVNNPILIVHRSMTNVMVSGMDAVVAVQEAVATRLRPIAMSTITTICGLAPLVLIPGAGTELYRGVGAIVMFGIIGAAVVSLTMLPALTIIVLQRVVERRDNNG